MLEKQLETVVAMGQNIEDILIVDPFPDPEVDKVLLSTIKWQLRHESRPAILDFGCGWGRIMPWVEYLGDDCRYLGVDPSPPMIEAAREINPGRDFMVGDADSLRRIGRGFFRAFFLMNVLKFIPPPMALPTLVSIRRVISPGGIGVLSYAGPDEETVSGPWPFDKRVNPPKVTFYSYHREWFREDVIRRAGFQLIDDLSASFSFIERVVVQAV